jgi:2-hydroxy-6-oxonona-2,4-dienedioate hydrolase
MKHRKIHVMGYNVFTRYSQRRHGQTLVFVHGLGASSRYWLPLSKKLQKTCNVYLPDLPGFGRSSKPQDALSIQQSADVLKETIRSIGQNPVTLVGNSYGCQVIIDMLSRHHLPEVKRAVLLGPTINRHERSQPAQIKRLLQDGKYEPTWSVAILIRDYLDGSYKRIKQTLDYAVQDRPERKLSSMQIPVMVVRGSEDPTVPEDWAQELAGRLPHGSFATIPGAGHATHINSPDQTARLIASYVGALRPAQRVPKALALTAVFACTILLARRLWLQDRS